MIINMFLKYIYLNWRANLILMRKGGGKELKTGNSCLLDIKKEVLDKIPTPLFRYKLLGVYW